MSTQGIIISKEPENHQFVHYQYFVRNSSFKGTGSSGYGTPEFDEMKVGDKVKVVYLLKQPQVSCLGEPRGFLENELISIALAAITIPLLILLGMITKFKFRRRRN